MLDFQELRANKDNKSYKGWLVAFKIYNATHPSMPLSPGGCSACYHKAYQFLSTTNRVISEYLCENHIGKASIIIDSEPLLSVHNPQGVGSIELCPKNSKQEGVIFLHHFKIVKKYEK